jgi:hypothetical protein
MTKTKKTCDRCQRPIRRGNFCNECRYMLDAEIRKQVLEDLATKKQPYVKYLLDTAGILDGVYSMVEGLRSPPEGSLELRGSCVNSGIAIRLVLKTMALTKNLVLQLEADKHRDQPELLEVQVLKLLEELEEYD